MSTTDLDLIKQSLRTALSELSGSEELLPGDLVWCEYDVKFRVYAGNGMVWNLDDPLNPKMFPMGPLGRVDKIMDGNQ